jgi:putative endonuclease
VRAKDELGRLGEDLAVRQLEAAGLQVLARNWCCPEGEIDIVARDPRGGELVICEVKTRSGVGYGRPHEAVNPRKVGKLRRLAYLWLLEHSERGCDVRFDVVSVLRPRTGVAVVEHWPAAF